MCEVVSLTAETKQALIDKSQKIGCSLRRAAEIILHEELPKYTALITLMKKE